MELIFIEHGKSGSSIILWFYYVSSILSELDSAGLIFDSRLFSPMAAVETTQPAQVDVSKTNRVPVEGYDKKCIFCKIVNNEMGTELLHHVRILQSLNNIECHVS